MKDVRGKTLEVGDIVAIGHDNGSTLCSGVIVKFTDKFVWIGEANAGKHAALNRRTPERVALIEKGKPAPV